MNFWPYSTSHELRIWFVFWSGLVKVYFTHIFEGYFSATGAIVWLPWQSYDCPGASEATLKDRQKHDDINPLSLII